jgi:16S rRNA (cytidine1402-2'-O)-methyltransferase
VRDKGFGKLFCVATPIGNLNDLTPRARSVLSEVPVIAAEDTRVLQDFCRDAQITTKAKFISYYDAKEAEKSLEILNLLLQGKSVAIVSDAGTPNIYDPGFRILKLAFENEIDVIPVPGASSVTAALSICPLPGLNFCFYGFAPPKSSARKKFFESINFDGRVVVFESPHRLQDHLEDAKSVWGEDKNLFLCRELTKKFEEAGLKTIGGWIAHFAAKNPKGEFVLIYEGGSNASEDIDPDQWLRDKMEEGLTGRDLLKEAQTQFKISRKDLYNKITALKDKAKK